MKTNSKLQSITILGKEWFDKVNGNSYFSADVLVNGKLEIQIPFQYGYGSHYEDVAWIAYKELAKRKFIHPEKDVPRYKYFQDNNIAYYANIQRGCLKRDLYKEAK